MGCSPCGHEESGATEQLTLSITSHRHMGFPAGSVHKEFTCNAGDTGDSFDPWGWEDLDGHEFEQTPGAGDGQGSLERSSQWGGSVGHN